MSKWSRTDPEPRSAKDGRPWSLDIERYFEKTRCGSHLVDVLDKKSAKFVEGVPDLGFGYSARGNARSTAASK